MRRDAAGARRWRFVVAAGRPTTGVAPDAGRLALGVGLALALAQAGVGFGFEGTFVTWTRSAVSGGGATSPSFLLFVTEVMGLYLMSSILVIRQTLPEKHRAIITDAMGGIGMQFEFYRRWFDAIFLCASLLTLMLYAAQSAVQRVSKLGWETERDALD